MGDKIKVFWLEPTDREKRWLRRYTSSLEHKCEKTGSYCNAMADFGEGKIKYTADGCIAGQDELKPPKDDPRWPTYCDACGHVFSEKDAHQLFTDQIYVRPDTGQHMSLREAPPGACWDAWWIAERHKDRSPGCGSMMGDDGRCLIVRCPDGHDWMIDARCRNCTLPQDNLHHCWVRHGKPEDGTLHVDKAGNTCSAGGGSILTGNWHGFLHGGYLVGC